MADPQDGLRLWLNLELDKRGCGASRDLAKALDVSPETISRMKNLDGSKETRRIEAHHIPIIADFFGEWPPGYRAEIDAGRLAMVLECLERQFPTVPPRLKAECAARLYRYAAAIDNEARSGG